MNREEMIQNLVVERFHQIVEQRRATWLLGVLEHGFKGYAHLGESELAREAFQLGLHAGHDKAAANEADFPDDDADEFPLSAGKTWDWGDGGRAGD